MEVMTVRHRTVPAARRKPVRYRKITAIIRRSRLEEVEGALSKSGVSGVTVTPVKGFGEYKNFFARDPKVSHVKVEVFALAERVDDFVRAIQGAARTGAPGDGFIAIEPVAELVRVRTGEAAKDEDLCCCSTSDG